MALCDYRLCDKCGGKAFYDADLNYQDADGSDAYLVCGEGQAFPAALDHLGDWAVLCDDCAKTHRCAIVPRAE